MNVCSKERFYSVIISVIFNLLKHLSLVTEQEPCYKLQFVTVSSF